MRTLAGAVRCGQGNLDLATVSMSGGELHVKVVDCKVIIDQEVARRRPVGTAGVDRLLPSGI